MKTISEIDEMSAAAEALRLEGKRIAFVPTMGYLHEGHMSLIREGRKRGDLLVVSIFVNPTQFGEGEDLDRYPRDMEKDISLLESAGVDILFYPDAGEIYGEGFQTSVEVTELSKTLCGRTRPGHFRGVATIVAKLFNIVRPHLALFGEKDYQQLAVIRRMVTDLNFNIKIVGMPIVREEGGLAMSSRNAYLSPEERTKALTLSHALKRAEAMFSEGQLKASHLIAGAENELAPTLMLDYLELLDTETLEPVDIIKKNTLLAVAAKAGRTRLIDNMILSVKEE